MTIKKRHHFTIALESGSDLHCRGSVSGQRCCGQPINGKFSATVASAAKVQALRGNLIDQICDAAGDPCEYKGKTIVQAHTGMNITADEFNALVEDLVASLDLFDVPEKEKKELLAISGPLQSDIVGK